MKVECPKCNSQAAWFKDDGRDVTLHCMCGYLKVVQTRIETIVIEHMDSGSEVKLPKQGSKLWDCLLTLHALQSADTGEITSSLNRGRPEKLTTNEVASQLTVLRYKTLVVVTENRKGYAGGSTWECTDVAKNLLKG